MPLPLILGIAAGVAAAAGVGSGIHGGVKMKEANDTMKSADERHKKNIKRFENENARTTKAMDSLGKYELETMKQFQTFADLFEKIQNRPEFKSINISDTKLPELKIDELRQSSIDADVALSTLKSLAVGSFSGVAAGGATIAISGGSVGGLLAGGAAANATLASVGGGAIAAGGAGMATGAAVLGGATLGVALLVGGIIFNATGCKLSEKADEAWYQMKKAEEEINKICDYLKKLCKTANEYNNSLKKVNTIYSGHLAKMNQMIEEEHRINWYDYSEEEQKTVENSAILTQLLYSMCKVQLVLKTDDKNGINTVNTAEVTQSQQNADTVLSERGLAAITPQAYSSANKGTVVFEAYSGVNKTAVAYLINNRTGISVDLANQLLSTGGEVSADDPKEFAEQLKSYGIKASADK